MSIFHAKSGDRRLKKTQKFSLAGVATLGAAAVAFTVVPASSEAQVQETQAAAAAAPVGLAATGTAKDIKASVTDQLANANLKAQDAAARLKAQQEAAAKQKAEAKAKAEAQAEAQQERKVAPAVSRSTERAAVATPVAAKTYANNLDGWIRESLDVMKKHKIPGTYNGLYRNIMRESSGNPMAINNWDINAKNGVPSKGLLQVIQPTFNAYHVPGTSWNIYDPVANITAAANYAADRYGSMDNVFGAY
ncbi:transglycosylase SLT domain-containing protein [Streptomyces sp. PSKA54]|uniref:Transglycosylase SLT domain-containing protein n=1 Tax=Streptomyces himalayensis subsp. aureolus TaxID=2758039 RepID=A0A7W2CVF2_9ACTN|nr:transglycosylase SLT domain-containing protein [Streptomyces himalayensis]MBA4859797.1 transglycosylase SLT domain-containing protein [Streptomyces himalayensis subsp. aureolus]